VYVLWGCLRDYGASLMSIICAVITVSIGYAMGIYILLIIQVVPGIAVIGVFLYVTYFLVLYIIYLKMNKSLPNFIAPLTVLLVFLTAFSVMIASFIITEFDDFVGFTITYLVLIFILGVYAIYLILNDLNTEVESPNFYSPYGIPSYKYKSKI
jgi:hypothetical protein